jgi:hypothetical protein
MTHSQLISTLGTKAIAEGIGVPDGRVRVWKCRNTIPRSAWAELIDAFPVVTLEKLKAGEAQ